MVPTDTCKYEIDKFSGYLKIDRPQKFSNIIPALYGFIPQTYCGEKTAGFAGKKSGRKFAAFFTVVSISSKLAIPVEIIIGFLV